MDSWWWFWPCKSTLTNIYAASLFWRGSFGHFFLTIDLSTVDHICDWSARFELLVLPTCHTSWWLFLYPMWLAQKQRLRSIEISGWHGLWWVLCEQMVTEISRASMWILNDTRIVQILMHRGWGCCSTSAVRFSRFYGCICRWFCVNCWWLASAVWPYLILTLWLLPILESISHYLIGIFIKPA